jgi:hypothetical protein
VFFGVQGVLVFSQVAQAPIKGAVELAGRHLAQVRYARLKRGAERRFRDRFG